PAALAGWVEVWHELPRDLRHQRFEALIPAVLFVVQDAVAMDHPSHVPRAVRAQRVPGRRLAVQDPLDRPHRLDQLPAALRPEWIEEAGDLFAGAPVERRKGFPAALREREMRLPGIRVRPLALEQAPLVKLEQDTAEVTGVESEIARDFGRRRAISV